jgi:dynein heavy chain
LPTLQVPALWAKAAYPSLKPLGSWVLNLVQRVQFFQSWIDNSKPSLFWISGFFFTQSFITGMRQNYARKHGIAIDQLNFHFDVMTHIKPDSGAPMPEEGCYIHGLYLDGCRWDPHTEALGESEPKVLYSEVPVIWLKPTTKPVPTSGVYESPVYRTSARKGTLSTTGHSTNFVLFILLPSDRPQKHWVKRGVAMLCALDD